MAANRAALDRWAIVPRILRDVSQRNLEVELFGRRITAPVLFAPVGAGSLAAPDAAAQKAICAEIQRQFFIDVPYLPLGAYYEATAYRGLTGLRTGFPQFYDVRPA